MTPIPSHCDTLVVGGGPVGLTLGLALLRNGGDPLVVDRASEGARDSRAAVLHLRALELLDALDVGSEIADGAAPIPRAVYHDVGLSVGELRFASLGGPFDAALGVPQHRIEAVLGRQYANAGGRLARPVRLETLTTLGDGVGAVVIDEHGDEHTIRAQHVVGCDGASSLVRDLAGLAGEERPLPETYVIADAPLRGDVARDAMHLFAADDGFLVLSPLPEGLWRLTATLADSPELPSREQLQLLVSDRGPRGASIELGPPVALGRYRVTRTVARRFGSGRLLIAGDAAHTFSPAGAQGMNVGIADAANLGWKLPLVQQGIATHHLLDTYDTERRPAAHGAVTRNDRFDTGLSLHNPLARGLRDALALVAKRVDALQGPVLAGLAGFDTIYESGAVGGSDDAARGWGRLGERFAASGRSTGAGSRHGLFVCGGEHAPMRLVAETRRLGIDVCVDDDPKRRGAALVRPDGHIGWLGRADDAAGLEAHLSRWYPGS